MAGRMELSLAYSPCPNDTFIFYHLISGKTKAPFSIKEELYDVEQLNRFADQGKFQATKISFAALFQVADKYSLLDSGSALGRNCGPIIVKKKGANVGTPTGKNILVPGLWTTANLLTHLYLKGNFTPIPTRYDLILDKVKNGEADFGIVIHEERFTYQDRGLEKVEDLGEWWEGTTGAHIPLGCIAIQREIPSETKSALDSAIKESLDLAYKNREDMYDYILHHSQTTTREVADAHIDLYVNEYSKSLGEEGRRAIRLLQEKALQTGLLSKEKKKELFL
ncbi:menaquinone biosynthesis protein [Leptospira langatensis]|uniref:1,4-dihydroxy-6-naphtoate synthase n=2 Tax=Leptospira langatensis TaxID=2484983 RepID=A0A5F1ZPT5_9LEPT|nr:menaquinone biosynthesis protein [Leptospira langatensis]TGL39343.1 menaquinone biosynthesis protein [Leptospira langatensis]